MKNNESEIVELDQSLIEFLRSERDRTSVGPQALLKPFNDLPKGLNHPMVTHWLGGRIKRAKKEHIDFVSAAWAKLPTNRSVEFSPTLLSELRELQTNSGATPEMIMRWSDAGQIGLSVSKIKHYLSGNARCILERHADFLKRIWSNF